jgi:hypothetical protein
MLLLHEWTDSCSASSAFPEFMSSDPFFAESLARGVCYVMSENLLSILPQLDDYTCPVCASITYRPGNALLFTSLMHHSPTSLFACLLHSMSCRPATSKEIPVPHLSS